jgi:hypothetical protein
MVASRPTNAMLIRASCWAQAGYSVSLRPAQIGSPMIRTRRPACWSMNACNTHGMIRPGFRPASVMSAQRTPSVSPTASRTSRRLAPGIATSTGSSVASPPVTNGTVPASNSSGWR